jgi:ERCC4-type nuclease
VKAKRIIPIVRDTREKNVRFPWTLARMDDVELIGRHLKTGDFTVDGYENLLMIERKDSIDELALSLTKGRARFEREWQRAQKHLVRRLVVAGHRSDILHHNYRSKLRPYDFRQSLASWQLKYHFEIDWCANFAEAQIVIADLCRQFQRIMEQDMNEAALE